MRNNSPKGWIKIKLENCCDILDNFRVPVNADQRSMRQGNVPYYGATGQVGWIDDFLFDEELILIGEDGAPFFDKSKNISYIINGKSWVNNHAHVLRAREITTNKFINYFLNNFDYNGFVNGTTRLKLNQSKLKEIPILVPPLAEQNRVVAKLDTIFARVTNSKARLEKIPSLLKTFRQSVLAAAVSGELTKEWRELNPKLQNSRHLIEAVINEKRKANIKLDEEPIVPPYEIPDKWEWVRLGVLSKYVTSGSRDWSKFYSETGAYFIRSAEINTNKLRLDECIKVDLPKKVEGKRSLVEKGDLLVTITGANVGKCAYIEIPIPEAYVSQSVALVKLMKIIDIGEYLHLVLTSPIAGGKDLLDLAYGIGRPVLSLPNIKELQIPLAPLKEQKEIVRRVEELFHFADSIEGRYQKAKAWFDKLPQSILAKAFRGELVPQDENDEPASELLKRIQQAKQTNHKSSSNVRKRKLV